MPSQLIRSKYYLRERRNLIMTGADAVSPYFFESLSPLTTENFY